VTAKHKVGGFMSRQMRRGARYSPHYGESEGATPGKVKRRGPCKRKGHIFMGGRPFVGLYFRKGVSRQFNIGMTCRRCGLRQG